MKIKNVPGYEEYYTVNEWGKVFSLQSNRYIKPSVGSHIDKKTEKVHRGIVYHFWINKKKVKFPLKKLMLLCGFSEFQIKLATLSIQREAGFDLSTSKHKGLLENFNTPKSELFFGSRIKDVRELQQVTSRQTADALGISEEQLLAYETGTLKPTETLLVRLSKFLRVPYLLFTEHDFEIKVNFRGLQPASIMY